MILLIIVFSVIYIISVIANYWYNHVAFSKNGRYSGLSGGLAELLFTIIPLVNTFSAVIIWGSFNPYYKPWEDYYNKIFNKIFNVKK